MYITYTANTRNIEEADASGENGLLTSETSDNSGFKKSTTNRLASCFTQDKAGNKRLYRSNVQCRLRLFCRLGISSSYFS